MNLVYGFTLWVHHALFIVICFHLFRFFKVCMHHCFTSLKFCIPSSNYACAIIIFPLCHWLIPNLKSPESLRKNLDAGGNTCIWLRWRRNHLKSCRCLLTVRVWENIFLNALVVESTYIWLYFLFFPRAIEDFDMQLKSLSDPLSCIEALRSRINIALGALDRLENEKTFLYFIY
jgi:hypothetical protein